MIVINVKSLESLDQAIEALSDQLAELIKVYSITAPEVIKKSREIDGLITEYHQALKEIK